MKAKFAYISRNYGYPETVRQRKHQLAREFQAWLDEHPNAEVVWVSKEDDIEYSEQWTIFYREAE